MSATLLVVYEDANLLVVEKPPGILTHAAPGQTGKTVADLIKDRTTDIAGERAGIVHRLDKETSGLLVVAKTESAREFLQQQFKDRVVKKTYLALVAGRLKLPKAVIDLPIGRRLSNPTQWSVRPGGRQAVTKYEVKAEYPGYSLVMVQPQTGRTHQIRVHFSHLGHPVAGDIVYGPTKPPLGLGRHFLHASAIEFTTPEGKSLKFESPLPADLQKFLDTLASD